MPVSEKDFRELTKTVAEVKTTVENSVGIARWGLGLAVTAVLAAVASFISLSIKVAVLESGGNPKLVSELKNPKSPETLAASLSSATAQLKNTKVSGIKPDAKKADALRVALTSVIDREPNLPEAWQAASALVSLRPASFDAKSLPPELQHLATPVQNYGNCFTRPFTWTENGPEPTSLQPGGISIEPIILHDCTLYIDDIEGFKQSALFTHHEAIARALHRAFLFTLVRVTIVYGGGELIPVVGLRAYGCTYQFSVPIAPAPNGRKLMQAVLDAPFKETKVDFGIGRIS